MNKIQVIFEYDESLRKWEVYVIGVDSELEAKQAFNAVILTCRMATPRLEYNKAILQSNKNYEISIGT